MKLLPILVLAAVASNPYAILGTKIGDDLGAFEDRYFNAFCGKETMTGVVCEQDDAVLYGHKAYMRAEFEGGKLRYFAFTMNAGPSQVKIMQIALRKQYGEPSATDSFLPDKVDEYWRDNDEMELSYTSAKENGLGHGVIRLSLAAKNFQNSPWVIDGVVLQ